MHRQLIDWKIRVRAPEGALRYHYSESVNGAVYLSTLSLVMRRQSNSCFSVAAPVLPVLMNESACLTAFGREDCDRLKHGVLQFACLDGCYRVRGAVETADLDAGKLAGFLQRGNRAKSHLVIAADHGR
jgi:hypothetical protein